MGAAPSRETIRRGLFNVNQSSPSTGGGGSGGGGNNRRQDIVLIPLTKEYFPSPDCPLFVQFHKARCDAAVNYYFRRPGNPGDLSCIPNYASSYRLPGEETKVQRRRRRQVEREVRAAVAASTAEEAGAKKGGAPSSASLSCAAEGFSASIDLAAPDNGEAVPEVNACVVDEKREGQTYDHPSDTVYPQTATTPLHEKTEGNKDSESEEEEEDSEDEEDESYPSREALYRGVIEHVEEALFDTDAEMCRAYHWSLAHPHTTMGPDGRKQRKVLPVLCAVAFRSDVSKVHSLHLTSIGATVEDGAAAAAASSSPSFPSPTNTHISSSSIAMNNMQAALESGVYMFGSIINIVGCFGFVSMQEDVEDAQRLSHQQRQADSHVAAAAAASANMSAPLLTPGSSPGATANGASGTYHHDPYSFTSSHGSLHESGSVGLGVGGSGGTLLRARAAHGKGRRHVTLVTPSSAVANPLSLPPPVAAPLAAMVFLTKSAGEQNLGRVTHIAASTYYFQMIQAGAVERQAGVRMEGPNVYPSPTTANPLPGNATGTGLPPYLGSPCSPPGSSLGGGADGLPMSPPPVYGMTPTSNTNGNINTSTSVPSMSPMTSPTTASGPARPFLPPMETFSFSSLLTNIPVLSFLYEMKWRWGYLGVLKGGTASAGSSRNSSFAGSLQGNSNNTGAGLPGASSARGPGSMMGNHSTGGLAAADRSVGQGVTDELEMWITTDQMIHGRISKELAQRLCWSLAERPEVMQERITQLPSEESGYWRYRGLVDASYPPPIPEPGKVVVIHTKDVYVMGSDVLPGFNEGDILRFDADRVVWFADHSIPLEGLVLAAMRPHCKQAREADPDDPAWVTKICDEEEAEALTEREGEIQYSGDSYPVSSPTAAQQAMLAADPHLVHVHEHVGNFYVYRFVRDGKTHYHGTVPNFANPNKKRQAGHAGSVAHGGGMAAAGNGPAESGNASQNTNGNSGGGAPGTQQKEILPSPSNNIHANNTFKPETTAATPSPAGTTTTSKSTVQVPKTIASALFSLLPASQAMWETSAAISASAVAEATNSSGSRRASLVTASMITNTVATEAANLNGRGSAASGGIVPNNGGPNTSAPSPTAAAGSTTTTAYLATPVTSQAMTTARRWVQVLYSYAYGAPNPGKSPATATTPTAARQPPVSGGLYSSSQQQPSRSQEYTGVGANNRSPVHVGRPNLPPLRATCPGDAALSGSQSMRGSYTTTPVHTPHMRGHHTPTSAPGSTFPNTAGYEVPVWPLRPGRSGHTPVQAPLGTGGWSPGASAINTTVSPPASVHHSRSSSRSLVMVSSAPQGIATGDGVGVGVPVGAAVGAGAVSKPIKRYVDGGSYEWDWRKQ